MGKKDKEVDRYIKEQRDARSMNARAFLGKLRDARIRQLCGHLLDLHDPYASGNVDADFEAAAGDLRKMDMFDARKRMIANKLTEIRQDLKKKAELIASGERGRPKVEITKKIHTDFDTVKQWMTECENFIRKEEQKLKGSKNEEKLRILSLRKQAFEIMQQHVAEVNELKKVNPGSRAQVPTEKSFATIESLNDPTHTGLPEIDLTEFNTQVKMRDDKINEGMRTLEKTVRVLKDQARELGTTLDEQNRRLEQVEDKVDERNEELYSLNKRLKETLAKVRGPGKFCVDVCCCILLLGLGGLIYNMVKG